MPSNNLSHLIGKRIEQVFWYLLVLGDGLLTAHAHERRAGAHTLRAKRVEFGGAERVVRPVSLQARGALGVVACLATTVAGILRTILQSHGFEGAWSHLGRLTGLTVGPFHHLGVDADLPGYKQIVRSFIDGRSWLLGACLPLVS